MATAEQEAAFSDALAMTHEVLNDREPAAQDKLLSLATRMRARASMAIIMMVTYSI